MPNKVEVVNKGQIMQDGIIKLKSLKLILTESGSYLEQGDQIGLCCQARVDKTEGNWTDKHRKYSEYKLRLYEYREIEKQKL